MKRQAKTETFTGTILFQINVEEFNTGSTTSLARVKDR
jgi:hypothetical protein